MVSEDELILERLMLLRDEVAYLKKERASVGGFHDYREGRRLRRAVERSLQVAVDACLDIGRLIISIQGFRYPETNQEVFRILAEEAVIPRTLLPALEDMARFRNLIVHDYARIDDASVYAILTKRLGDFTAFATAVHAWLEG